MRHLHAAAAGAADHHDFPLRVEFVQAIRELPHGNVHDVGGHRRQGRFPVLAHVQQGHFGAARAPVEEFPGGYVLDHQNTNFCAATAPISGSMTVSNKLSRIHSLSSTRRTRMASITGAVPTMANKRPPTRSERSKRLS